MRFLKCTFSSFFIFCFMLRPNLLMGLQRCFQIFYVVCYTLFVYIYIFKSLMFYAKILTSFWFISLLFEINLCCIWFLYVRKIKENRKKKLNILIFVHAHDINVVTVVDSNKLSIVKWHCSTYGSLSRSLKIYRIHYSL